MNSKIVVTLRSLSRFRFEVEIKMFDAHGNEFFHLDQYFSSQAAALAFINKMNNARQQVELVL